MKKVKLLGMVLMLSMILTACAQSMSYTFSVTTGDSIKVKLNAAEGYTLEQADGVFSVIENDEAVLQGFFVTAEMYDAYLAAVAEAEAEIIENATKNGCTYMQYQLVSDTHTENNFICWIDGSNTGVVLASTSSQEDAEEAFSLLSFSY